MTCTVVPRYVVLGSIPDLDDICGRDTELAVVTDLLLAPRSSGVVHTGDRRFGKTCLRRLVARELRRRDANVVEVSAERGDYRDFIDALADQFEQHGRLRSHVAEWRLHRVSVGSFELERSKQEADLEALIRGALKKDPDQRLVLIIDEVTVLALKMERAVPGSGDNFLHMLRRVRQYNVGRLSMLLLGSVGFHHIANDTLGTTNDPVTVPVRAVSRADAICGARCLIRGEAVRTDDEIDLADAIADAAERVPFYIQHLVRSAREFARSQARPVTAADVPDLVSSAIIDPNDPWDLRHYSDRIPTYYGEAAAPLVIEVLHTYASSPAPIDIDTVVQRLGTSGLTPQPTRATLVPLVRKLELDHYLTFDGALGSFSSGLVQRAWTHLWMLR